MPHINKDFLLKLDSKYQNYDTFIETWDKLFTRIHDEKGSWGQRTDYVPYEMRTY